MKIKEIKAISRGRFKVCFDGEADLILYKKELTSFDLKEEADVSPGDYDRIMNDIIIPRARKRALYLLQRMDRTEENLKKKLLEGGYPEAAANDAVSFVRSYNYIDDGRYAESYISCYQDKKSKDRIRQDLILKGIDKNLIEEKLNECYEGNEREMIRALIKKRNFDRETSDRKERDKIIRFLLSRGYKMDDIMSEINS